MLKALDNSDFKTQPNVENLNLIRLTVKDLEFSNYATTEQIYQRAHELGLIFVQLKLVRICGFSYSGQIGC